MRECQNQRPQSRRVQPKGQFARQNLAFAGDDFHTPSLLSISALDAGGDGVVGARRGHAVQVQRPHRAYFSAGKMAPGGFVETRRCRIDLHMFARFFYWLWDWCLDGRGGGRRWRGLNGERNFAGEEGNGTGEGGPELQIGFRKSARFGH